jgi:hypothetical protein
MRATRRAISFAWSNPRERWRDGARGSATTASGSGWFGGLRATAAQSASARKSASASRPPYLNACSRRSKGNAYSNAAYAAANGGGIVRQAPQTAPFHAGSAQRGQA